MTCSCCIIPMPNKMYSLGLKLELKCGLVGVKIKVIIPSKFLCSCPNMNIRTYWSAASLSLSWTTTLTLPVKINVTHDLEILFSPRL